MYKVDRKKLEELQSYCEKHTTKDKEEINKRSSSYKEYTAKRTAKAFKSNKRKENYKEEAAKSIPDRIVKDIKRENKYYLDAKRDLEKELLERILNGSKTK